MTDLSIVRSALDRLKMRLAEGALSHEEYRVQRGLLLEGLTPEELRAIGFTGGATGTPTSGSTPAPGTPWPAGPTSGSPVGPSGGSGRGMATRLPQLAELKLAPGDELAGRWRIERELGRGGFGVVVLARDLRLEKMQAVKVLDPAMVARPDLLSRFRREVALTRDLVHPRIVRVFEYVEDANDGLALFSMEHVKGSSVRLLLEAARLRREPIPLALSLWILGQVLEALEAAHSEGVIHRDVTPANILLAGGTSTELLADAERDPQVKLVDFGIAGAIERSEMSQKSRVLGTAAYVAPEVLDPNGDVTPAADVYGAGAVFYELVTGRLPLGRFEDPSAVREGVGKAIDELALALLRQDPRRRPAVAAARRAAGEARQAMEPVAAPPKPEPSSAPVPPPPRPRPTAAQSVAVAEPATTEKSGGRGRIVAGVVGAVALIVVAAGVVNHLENRPSPAPVETPVPQVEAPPTPTVVEKVVSRPNPTEVATEIPTAAPKPSQPPKPTAIAIVLRPTAEPTQRPTEMPSPRPSPTVASASALPPEVTSSVAAGMRLVLIPAGSFQMGCSDGDTECDDNEKPVRSVTIAEPFYLGKYEVTQGEWEAVMGKNRSYDKGAKYPVENESWDDVKTFIRKLNEKEGRTDYRLPTAAEWEYAARAGSKGARYGDLGSVAWYDANSGRTTHEVGGKAENAWHLHDMLGNVREWVEDLSGSLRAYRGGGIYYHASGCRVSKRAGADPAYRDGSLGFRLARGPAS